MPRIFLRFFSAGAAAQDQDQDQVQVQVQDQVQVQVQDQVQVQVQVQDQVQDQPNLLSFADTCLSLPPENPPPVPSASSGLPEA